MNLKNKRKQTSDVLESNLRGDTRIRSEEDGSLVCGVNWNTIPIQGNGN